MGRRLGSMPGLRRVSSCPEKFEIYFFVDFKSKELHKTKLIMVRGGETISRCDTDQKGFSQLWCSY